ncbi:hypothetical protein [Luteococcus peritonei]|uniref:Uncharacterized protein n=1 Tax=Luteococcus peritonei TaxID=88874 RepID=A0ABW4S0D4_9ACTN
MSMVDEERVLREQLRRSAEEAWVEVDLERVVAQGRGLARRGRLRTGAAAIACLACLGTAGGMLLQARPGAEGSAALPAAPPSSAPASPGPGQDGSLVLQLPDGQGPVLVRPHGPGAATIHALDQDGRAGEGSQLSAGAPLYSSEVFCSSCTAGLLPGQAEDVVAVPSVSGRPATVTGLLPGANGTVVVSAGQVKAYLWRTPDGSFTDSTGIGTGSADFTEAGVTVVDDPALGVAAVLGEGWSSGAIPLARGEVLASHRQEQVGTDGRRSQAVLLLPPGADRVTASWSTTVSGHRLLTRPVSLVGDTAVLVEASGARAAGLTVHWVDAQGNQHRTVLAP